MAVTRQEVIEKVTDFVNRKFGGDWKKCFDAHDEDGDGRLSTDEVCVVLSKSGIGYRISRWAIAAEIIKVMDSDGDDRISYSEFQSMTHMK